MIRLTRIALALCLITASACAIADSAAEQLAAASALFDAAKYAEAAQKLDAFLTANPNHAKAGIAAFTLGRCRIELKQYPQAIAAYERAVSAKDASVTTLAQLGLGEAAMRAAQYDKAATALDQALKAKLRPEQASAGWYWLGEANLELKRYSQAEIAYLKVTRDYPQSDYIDNAWYGAAVAAQAQNQLDVARDRLRILINRYPKSEARADAMLLVAQIDLAAKRHNEARAEFEAFMRDSSYKNANAETRADTEDGLIQVLIALKDDGALIPLLESALNRLPASSPQRYRAALSLGNCRYRQKQYEPALNAYREAAKSSEQTVAAEGLYWTGNVLLAQGRNADAAVEFGRLVAKYPQAAQAPKAQLRCGDAYSAANQPTAAVQAYHVVVDKWPQSPEADKARKALGEMVDAIDDPAQLAQALKSAPPAERAKGTLRLARIHITAKHYPQAVSTLTEFVATKPENDVFAEAQYLIGICQSELAKDAAAANALADAVKRAPNAAWAQDAQSRLAWLYIDLKQPANAERAAQAALAQKPSEQLAQQAKLALVQALLDQQKWDAALDGAKALLTGNPSSQMVAMALYTQAWVSDKRGKPDEALPVWERIANEFARSAYADEALLKVGDARLKASKYDEARDKYSALLSAFPKSPLATEARFKLGSAQYNLDHPTDAAREFDAVSAEKPAGPYVPEALYWAGVAYSKSGQKAEAIQRLTKLVNDYPQHARVPNAKTRLAALKATE